MSSPLTIHRPFARSCLPAALTQKGLSKLDVLGHAEAAVHLDGFGEELAGLLAVAGGVAVEEYAGVPAARLRLLDDVGQLFRATQGCAEVFLGLRPVAAGAGRYPGKRIEKAAIVSADDDVPFHRLPQLRIEFRGLSLLAEHGQRFNRGEKDHPGAVRVWAATTG